MKRLPTDTVGSDPFLAFLGDLEALGVTPVPDGGLRYARIAARSNARWWLLPIDSRKAAAEGLEMLQPISKAAMIAKAALYGMVRFGPQQLLRRDQIRLSGLPDLTATFNGRAKNVAWFTGTDGPHRKTTLQAMDFDGSILGYAKLSRAAHVRAYIRNEASALQRVAELELTCVDVPRVLSLHDDETLTMLVTDSRKTSLSKTSRQLGPDHLRLLEELRKKTERVGGGGLVEELARQLSMLKPLVGTEWIRRVNRALAVLRPVADQIPVCFTHGDFTPWNTFFQGERLYVFDWEYSNAAWPVGFDLTHFILATTPADAQLDSLQRLQNTLAMGHFTGDRTAAARGLLLSLICHAMFYLVRLAEAGSTLQEWSEGAARGRMIDRLLDNGDLGS